MRRSGQAIIAVLVLCLAGLAIGDLKGEENERRALVVHGDAFLAPGDAIEKLLVIGGDARIEGAITTWIAVIEGNLTVAEGGSLSGMALIVDGRLTDGPGSSAEPVFILEFPRSSAAINGAAWIVVFGLIFGLSALAFAAWLSLRLLRAGINRFPFLGALWDVRRQNPMLLVLMGLAVSAMLLALFVHLAEETIYQQEADLADNLIIWLVHSIATSGFDRAMTFITYAGAGAVYIVFAPVVAGLLLFRGLKREGSVLVICLAGAALLNYLLKHLFERARPDLYRVIAETGYSFPSGHAMVSSCFYGMAAYIAGRHIASAWKRRAFYAATALLIGTIGFSRIYLGVHYPSDIAGGYIAGGTWLAFCISFLWWWEHKKRRRNSKDSQNEGGRRN